jgi:hypothetical protein
MTRSKSHNLMRSLLLPLSYDPEFSVCEIPEIGAGTPYVQKLLLTPKQKNAR